MFMGKQTRYEPDYEDVAVFIGCASQLALYIFSGQYLWRYHKTRSDLLWLGYMTVLLALEALVLSWGKSVVFYAAVFVLTFVADLFMLCQCWKISSKISKAALPGGVALLLTALGTYSTFGPFGALSLILTAIVSFRVLLYRILPPDNVKHYLVLLFLTLLLEYVALYNIFILVVLKASLGRGNEVWVALCVLCQQLAIYMFVHCLGMASEARKKHSDKSWLCWAKPQ